MKTLRLGISTLILGLVCLWISPAQACRHTDPPGSSLFSPLNWTPGVPMMSSRLPCPEDLAMTSTPGRGGAAHSEQRISRFIDATFDNVTADIARGGGEYVSSLARLLGLSDEQRAGFETVLREETFRHTDVLADSEAFLQLAERAASSR